MKLRWKIFLGSACLAVIPVFMTAIFTNQIAAMGLRQVLTENAKSHITYIREAKNYSLQEKEFLMHLEELRTEMTKGTIPIALLVFFFGGIAGLLFFCRIVTAISHLETVVTKIAHGDFTARANIQTGDELETLSNTFNALLEERITALARAEKENEQIKNDIIELIKKLSKIKLGLELAMPLNYYMSSPLEDDMYQMATETSKVLFNIRNIADEMVIASRLVKWHGEKVSNLAEAKRGVVDSMIAEQAAAARNKIAVVAQSCHEIADYATRTTETALVTITSLVECISEIQQTIHEIKKRIKCLCERVQEIFRIRDIVNDIYERTHLLSLNASMKAAAAGEAGRGFSVVADELLRLVESSRNVHVFGGLNAKIQLEISDIIIIMNKSFEQVVSGLEKVEEASEQMKDTQDTISNLVQVVAQLAMASKQQAQISNELRERAGTIQKSTQEMGRQLEEQTIQTDRLVDFSQQLIYRAQPLGMHSLMLRIKQHKR